MTGNRDRFGELIEPLEDDADPGDDITRVTRDEIHTDRIAELRRILKDARDRREAQP